MRISSSSSERESGVTVKDFKNPVIDFDRNNTYIQSEGINQDFGVYDSPDELLKAVSYTHLTLPTT